MRERLAELLDSEEELFLQAVCDAVKNFPDIIGVLAVGSLIQPIETPDGFFISRYSTPRGFVYERIRNSGRRRFAVREGSDLDLWLCTKDTDISYSAREKVELGGIALLSV